jgi:hypothetical protein
MHEIKPLSLKLRVSVREEIRSVAIPMGYTEHGFIVESVKAILRMIQLNDMSIPSMVIMARSLRDNARNPSQLQAAGNSREMAETGTVLPGNPLTAKSPGATSKKRGVEIKQAVQVSENLKSKNRKRIRK